MLKLVKTGQKTVATAGTQLALVAAKTLVENLLITAPAANAGVVYIGDADVSSTTGLVIAAGATVNLADLVKAEGKVFFDLNKIYVDAATNGDKVTFLYLTSGKA